MGDSGVHNAWLQRVLLALIAIQIVALAVSLPGQRIQGDEAAFAEIAYWQSQDGYPHSELFRGLLNYEERILLCHKLWEALGALTIWVFGFGIWPLRALSLMATVGLLLLLWWYVVHKEAYSPKTIAQRRLQGTIAVVFILIAPLTFKFAKFFRPEMALALLGLASFVLLRRSMDDESVWPAALSGIVAGLAVLTHLNGIVFVIAGIALLVARKRIRHALLFSIAAGAVSALFFYDIVGRWNLFWYQYINDPTFVEGERTVIGTLSKLLSEHTRLFRKPEIIFTSILYFSSLLVGLVPKPRHRRDSRFYVVALIIALGALAPAKTTPYAIVLFPFFALETAHVAGSLINRTLQVPQWMRVVFLMCAAMFVIHGLAADAVNAVTDKQDWHRQHQEIAKSIPRGARVLAPLDFVFDELENYQIAGMRLAYWRIAEWSDRSYDLGNLARYADSAGVDAIVLNKRERHRLPEIPTALGVHTGPFKLVNRSDADGPWLWLRDTRQEPE